MVSYFATYLEQESLEGLFRIMTRSCRTHFVLSIKSRSPRSQCLRSIPCRMEATSVHVDANQYAEG